MNSVYDHLDALREALRGRDELIAKQSKQVAMLREATAPLLRDIYRRTKDGAPYCNDCRGGGEYEGWQTAGRVPHEDHCIYGPLETALAATEPKE